MGNEPCKCLKGGDPDQEVKVTALPVVGDASMDAEDRVLLLLFWWNMMELGFSWAGGVLVELDWFVAFDLQDMKNADPQKLKLAADARYMRVVLRVQRHWRVVTARKRFATQAAAVYTGSTANKQAFLLHWQAKHGKSAC